MSDAIAEAVATGGEGEAVGESTATAEEILGSVGLLESATSEAAASEAATDGDAEKTDEKPAGEKKKTRREFEAFLLSEAELAKPGGHEKAATYLNRRQSKLDGFQARIERKGEALANERQAAAAWFAAEQQKLESDRATARNLVALVKRLEDPENMADVLDAIGEITGRKGAGREIWEKLAQFAIKGGKRSESSAELARVREELAELKATLAKAPEEQQRQAKEAEDARLMRQIEERKQALITSAKDAAKYPELARQLAALPSLGKNVVADVLSLRRKARESGAPIDISTALGRIEAALARKAAQPSPRETAGSQVAATVTSIAPSQARTSAVVREKTQEERDRDLAADTSFLSNLGFA